MKLTDFPEIVIATSKSSDGNMSIYCGDIDIATANKNAFFKKLKIDPQTVSELKQIHSNKVITLNKTTNKNNLADGLITNKRNIYLMIKTADCLPIAIYDPKNKATGLIHAGWKGLDEKIISKAISKMQAEFNSNPKDLIIYIGPSIGPCCYKNSPTFKQRTDPKWQPFIKHENGSFSLDLWLFAEKQLKEASILAENIENPKICTYHSGEYFSHRRAENQKLPNDYRFATVLGIKK